MRMLFILAGILSLSAAAAQNQSQPGNNGVIYGTVLTRNGTPARGLTLNALPLGVALLASPPRTKTSDAGAYRFEHLHWSRYTVYAEDQEAGYSAFSTGEGGPGHPEVELTAEHPEAEFNFSLPPPAGFLLVHLTNRSTGASISGIEVTVMSGNATPQMIFSGSFSSADAILVPSNRDLLLHVTSPGFLEWEESMGAGKRIRIPPGNRLTLEGQLQPSNALTARIPDANPTKYQGIHDAKEWRNPLLILRADGIEVAGGTDRGSPLTVEAATAILEGLPDSAWPYGRVVAVQDKVVLESESERSRVEANRSLLLQRLRELGVIVGF